MPVKSLSKNLRYAVMEAETVVGTGETPLAADFNVRIWNPELTLTIEMDDEASKDATGDHAEFESLATVKHAQIAFDMQLPWGGAVNVDPGWFKVAEHCGAVTKDYAAAGVAITPGQANDEKTCTIWAFDKERGGAAPVSTIYKLTGAMGNMRIGAEKPGAPWKAQCVFSGVLDDIVDGSALALTAPDTALAEKWLSSTFTWTPSGTLYSSSWAMDFGNEIVPVYDQSTASGISHFSIATRRARFTTNPLAQKQATDDTLADILAQTTGPISVGSTNYTLKGVDAQLLTSQLADREGFVAWDQTYKLLRNGTTGAEIDADLNVEDTWELLVGARA